MATKKTENSLLPSVSGGGSIARMESLHSLESTKSRDGQYILQEAGKNKLRAAATADVAAFAISKAGELQVHAGQVFADGCSGIDRSRDQLSGKSSQEYANTYAHHQKDALARHLSGIYEAGMAAVRAEVSNPLPRFAPSVEKKSKGLLGRVLGG